MSSEVLNITKDTPVDETVKSHEFHAYEPTGAAN